MTGRAIVILLLAVSSLGGLFLAALIEATPRPPSHVAVIAEAAVYAGEAPWVVRLSAVDLKRKAPARVTGTAAVGAERVELHDGVARLHLTPGPEPVKQLRVEVDVDGARSAVVRCAVRVEAGARPRADLWRRATPEPVRVEGVRRRAVALSQQGSALVVEVASPDAEAVVVDLLVDGVLRDVALLQVRGTARATLVLPADTAPDALIVAHAGLPWPRDRGPWTARLAGGAQPPPGQEPAQLRPAPLLCLEDKEAHGRPLRRVFEVAALAFVAVVAGLAGRRARGQGARGWITAFLATVALCALLGGLDIVLGLGIRS